jgi:hypothetical protein
MKLTGRFEAASPVDVTVNKELLEISIPPKGFRTEVLTFRNEGVTPVTIRTDIKPAKNEVNGEILPTDSGSKNFTAENLVTVEPLAFVLEPGGLKHVKVNIKLPENAQGGKYACLVFQVRKEKEQKLPLPIYVPILVAVPGTGQKKLELMKIYTRNNPPHFEIIVKNTGNIHLKLRGKLVIAEPLVAKPTHDEHFQSITEVPLKEDGVCLLPEEIIRLTGPAQARLKTKKNFGKIFLDYGEQPPFIEVKEFHIN